MGLSTYKQIRFLTCPGSFGNVQLVINRPGNNDLIQAAPDTLLLGEGGEYYPFIVDGDFDLSKKLTTTRGRRAQDNIDVGIRDGLGYTGTVNGSNVSEDFTSSFQTFFDVWFNETGPYRVFLIYNDSLSGNQDICGGWIDPTYRVSTGDIVFNPCTSDQIWLGTRTFQITALSNAQLSETWQDALNLIGPSDCQSGIPYNGFFIAPSSAIQSQTRDTLFGSGNGKYCLGVPYVDYQNKLQTLPFPGAVWPATPWVSNVSNQIIQITFGAGSGTGYNVGDVLTVGGGTGGILVVTLVSPGIGMNAVLRADIQSPGSGYSTGIFAASGGSGSGCMVKITQVGNSTLYGPAGYVFIQAGVLFAKCAQVLGLTTFNPATDLVSALDFFAQKADNTNQNYPIDPTPIPLTNVWLSLNVFAKAHPADGSYWDNPLGFSPTTLISDCITGLCNFLLSDFNEVWVPSGMNAGQSALQLKPMGATPTLLPNWPVIGAPSQEDVGSSPRIVQVNNRQDNLKIECPSGIVGDTVSIETLLRLHRIAATSGLNLGPDQECLLLDSSKKDTEQAEECFKIAWIDQNDPSNYVLNPNCWKSLACAFWFNASNTNVVYGSNWSPFEGTGGSWANSFYAINACYQSGQTPPANLQAIEKGNDYFNSRCYHAVAFAKLTLSSGTIQVFAFSGVTDANGSLQNITGGIAGTWRLGANPSEVWRGLEVDQTLLEGTTQIKFQAQEGSGFFPQLTDLQYDVVSDSGGTSSTSGGGTSSSSSGSGNNPTPTVSAWPYIPITIAGAGTQPIPNTATINKCHDSSTTGVSVAFGLVGNVITIVNRTGHTFTTGDFKVPDSTTWTIMFMEDGVQFDPLVKTGWDVLFHNP